MKNLFLLPTDKPSRLYEGNLGKPVTIQSASAQLKKPLNIYITSDEEIKEGEYGICLNLVREGFKSHQAVFKMNLEQRQAMEDLGGQKKAEVLKIILTTDADLIKDGVQAIDDEFLEWFCKNSSYEWVEVKSLKTIPALQLTGNNHCMYQLIVPKEEESDYNGKQEIKWISENQSCKQIDSCYNSLSKKCICPKEEPKQETLEEAKIEYHFENDIEMFEFMNEMASTGKIPKKWSLFVSKINDLYRQQERMYSEEELLQILESHKDNLEFDKDKFEHDRWFEQFKKK